MPGAVLRWLRALARAGPRERTDVHWAAEIVPPRVAEGPMAQGGQLFATLAHERLAFELGVRDGETHWLLRGEDEATLERALRALRLSYPDAVLTRIEHGRADCDPGRIAEWLQTVELPLLPLEDEALALRWEWWEAGGREELDPLEGIVAAALAAGPDVRLVCRLRSAPADGRAAARLRRRAAGGRPRWRREEDEGTSAGLIVPLLGLALASVLGLEFWRWYQQGQWGLLLLAAGGVLAVAAGAGWLARQGSWLGGLLGGGSAELAEEEVTRKLGSPLVGCSLSVIAAAPPEHPRAELEALVQRVAESYGEYATAGGGGLRPGRLRRGRRAEAAPRWGRATALLLNARECEALWHLPGRMGAAAGVRRNAARRLEPAPGHVRQGVVVGEADSGAQQLVHMPRRLLYRNHLSVAKTRRGKSNLFRHVAAGVMAEMVAEERERGHASTALVVVDPHQDMAEQVLEAVPPELAERTVYLDFGRLDYPPGLNLLDVAQYPERGRAVENVLTIGERIWSEFWGPRMEPAFRNSLATLHTVNQQLPREQQFTILDVNDVLTNREFRALLTARCDDPVLSAYWRQSFDELSEMLRQQTANPVTSKVGRLLATEATQLVFGQSASTFDPAAVIREGGVLIVNTAVGTIGEGAASLVGASLVNLVGLEIAAQGQLPAGQRQRVVGLLDESSTLGAVDYTWLLSELGKFGGGFHLVTQSLEKLDAIDRELTQTIFANIDGLTVFQVSAPDARRLVAELGGGLEEEDLIALPDFTCYARWQEDGTKAPPFSFRVRPPPAPPRAGPGRLTHGQEIAESSALRFGRPRDEVAAEIAAVLRRRAEGMNGSRGGRQPRAGRERAAPRAEPGGRRKPAGVDGAARDGGPGASLARERGGAARALQLQRGALEWVARVPLLTRRELAALTGCGEYEMRGAVAGLHAGGWVETIASPDPDDEGERVVAIAAGGEQAVLEWAGAATRPAALRGDRALAGLTARFGSTRDANACLAALAVAARREGLGSIAWACSFPPGAREGRAPAAWALPGTQAAVVWEAAGQAARGSLFVDSHDVPRGRRQALLRRWRQAVRAEQGAGGAPLLLLLCSSEERITAWSEDFRALAGQGRGGAAGLPVVLAARIREGCDAGLVLTQPVWSRLDGADPQLLADAVAWVQRNEHEEWTRLRGYDGQDLPARRVPAGPAAHERWAAGGSRGALWRETARLALTLDGPAVDVVRWLTRQAWLSIEDLADLSGHPLGVVRARVGRLREEGVVDEEGEGRHVLSASGLRLAAGWAGYTARQAPRYAREAGIASSGQIRQPGHTSGVARSLALLGRAGRARGWVVTEWWNERRYHREYRRREDPRPDGVGLLSGAGGKERGFLVEYERNTRREAMERKVANYLRWYRGAAWRALFREAPPLLVICDGADDERRAHAALPAECELPLFTIVEQTLAERGFGAHWLSAQGARCDPLEMLTAGESEEEQDATPALAGAGSGREGGG